MYHDVSIISRCIMMYLSSLDASWCIYHKLELHHWQCICQMIWLLASKLLNVAGLGGESYWPPGGHASAQQQCNGTREGRQRPLGWFRGPFCGPVTMLLQTCEKKQSLKCHDLSLKLPVMTSLNFGKNIFNDEKQWDIFTIWYNWFGGLEHFFP